jgi:hypothetical protein
MRAGRITNGARILLVIAAAALAACDGPRPDSSGGAASGADASQDRPAASGGCTASYEAEDPLSPSYKPDAPRRTVVGHGHVLTGTVRSSRDCAPIPGAQVELWPEIAGKGHPDAQRATVVAAADGSYRFQSDPPEHIHLRASAPGFRPMASNRYHPEDFPTHSFDILLAPADG